MELHNQLYKICCIKNKSRFCKKYKKVKIKSTKFITFVQTVEAAQRSKDILGLEICSSFSNIASLNPLDDF